jgi:hypothetical protein
MLAKGPNVPEDQVPTNDLWAEKETLSLEEMASL